MLQFSEKSTKYQRFFIKNSSNVEMVLTKPHNHYKIYNKFKSLSKSNKT